MPGVRLVRFLKCTKQMGLHIHSLGQLPATVERAYYVYLPDYGWHEPLGAAGRGADAAEQDAGHFAGEARVVEQEGADSAALAGEGHQPLGGARVAAESATKALAHRKCRGRRAHRMCTPKTRARAAWLTGGTRSSQSSCDATSNPHFTTGGELASCDLIEPEASVSWISSKIWPTRPLWVESGPKPLLSRGWKADIRSPAPLSGVRRSRRPA